MIPDDQKKNLDRMARVAQLNYFIAKTEADLYMKEQEKQQILRNREAYEEELRQLQEGIQLPEKVEEVD